MRVRGGLRDLERRAMVETQSIGLRHGENGRGLSPDVLTFHQIDARGPVHPQL